MTKKLTFTAKTIRAVAESHITMFQNRIASGARNVRVSECERYLDIWLDLRDSVLYAHDDNPICVDDLAPAERRELLDAYACGDYDDIFNAESTPPVADPHAT